MVDFLCSALDVSTGVVFKVTSSRRHFKSEAGSIWRKKMRFEGDKRSEVLHGRINTLLDSGKRKIIKNWNQLSTHGNKPPAHGEN